MVSITAAHRDGVSRCEARFHRGRLLHGRLSDHVWWTRGPLGARRSPRGSLFAKPARAVTTKPSNHGRMATKPDHDVARETRWAGPMVAAQDGDRAAYNRLLREIRPFIRAVVARQHRPADRAEDVVEDVLLTGHRFGTSTIRRDRSPIGWRRSRGGARSTCCDAARTQRAGRDNRPPRKTVCSEPPHGVHARREAFNSAACVTRSRRRPKPPAGEERSRTCRARRRRRSHSGPGQWCNG
jgi:hypothetical protein